MPEFDFQQSDFAGMKRRKIEEKLWDQTEARMIVA